MPRADRIFALVQFLTGPRFRKLEEITKELGAAPRTIYRDLATLEERGYPIDRQEGAYRIALTATLKPLPLTDRERALLAVSLENPALERQPAFTSVIRQLRAKLIALHDLDRARVARDAGPDRSGDVPKPALEALEKAILERHSVSFLYQSLSGRQRKWRGIDPWIIVHRSDAWYLVGRCHINDEPRIFRLDRIEAVLPIGSAFERPADFDADRWFANSWGVYVGEPAHEVVIEFDESVAPLIVYAQHHPSERKRRLEDGRLEYRVDVGALDEIARWIVGFGGTARVIAPDELIERVREIAAGAASVHTRITRAAAMTKKRRGRSLTDSDTT